MKKRRVKKSRIYVLIFILITIIILAISLIFIRGVKNKVNTKAEKSNEKVKVDTNNFKLRDGEELVDTTYKGYKVTKLNEVYYVDGVIIVNKTYPLPSTYQPQNPYKPITSDYIYGEDYIEKEVMEAYLNMKDEALKQNINLKITSGYRSYKVQVDLYNNYMNRDGKEAADTYSARAGFSEHQSGLCFDLNGTNPNFIETSEGKWLNDNAYKYGFILRFPKGKEDKTGYMYEGWHFRYVGVELATKLYNNGNWISLEEYYGITSKYTD